MLDIVRDKLLKVWDVHLKFTFLKSTGPEAPIVEETLFYRLKTIMNTPLNVNATTCCRIIRLFQTLPHLNLLGWFQTLLSILSYFQSANLITVREKHDWCPAPPLHIPCSRYGNNKAKHKRKLVGVALGKPWAVCEDDWFHSQNAKQPQPQPLVNKPASIQFQWL